MGKCLPNWPRLYFTFSMAMFFAFSSSCGRFLSGKMYNQFNIIIDTHHITSCGNWKSVLDKKLGTELPTIYMYLGSQALEKIFPLLAVKSVLNKKEVLTEICSKRYNRVAVELGWKEILFFIDTCCFYWYLLTYK